MDCHKTCRRSCTSYCRASRSRDARRHKTGPTEQPGLQLQNTSHPPERVSKSERLQERMALGHPFSFDRILPRHRFHSENRKGKFFITPARCGTWVRVDECAPRLGQGLTRPVFCPL